MPDSSKKLRQLIAEFKVAGKALPVNFRDLVSWLPYNSPRFTHQIHSYPAKVIPHIPHFFLACSSLIEPNSKILDPFGGSGTVALEACLSGHDAIISDSNPLARLITKVKTTPISSNVLSRSISHLRVLIQQTRACSAPEVVNIEYWYHHKTIKQLSRVSCAIAKLDNSPFKRLCQVALSMTSRKVSLADPRVAVPVKLKPERYPLKHPLRLKSADHLKAIQECNAVSIFFDILKTFADQVETLWPLRQKLGRLEQIYFNSLDSKSKSLQQHPSGSVDAIITSPPYLGAQKYIRSSSLSLGWLAMTTPDKLRSLEDNSIGREHFPKSLYQLGPQTSLPQADKLIAEVYERNPLRARIAATYLIEMRQVLENCYRLLKPNGSMVLVSGCNILCGEFFDTTAFLRNICIELGFNPAVEMTDIIQSRGLMTRRNKTAAIIPLESVILFKK